MVKTKFEGMGQNIVLIMYLEKLNRKLNQKQNLYLPITVRSLSKGLIA